MKTKQKGFALLELMVVVALLTLIGSIGYIYLQPKQEASKPFESMPAIETTAETADWKTYRNKKHGYEIKYPPNTKVGNFDISGFIQAKQDDDMVGVFLPDDGGEGRGSINIMSLIQTSDYNHKYCMSLNSAAEKAKCAFPATQNIESFNPQNITFAGIDALKFGNNIDFSHNDFEYRISSYFIEENKSTIDFILGVRHLTQRI